MKRFLALSLTACALVTLSGAGFSSVKAAEASLVEANTLVGKEAPEFTLKDIDGKEHKLSDYKGKLVVLEWVNDGCPFVQKHYKSGNMQKLQSTYTKKGVIWLTICSSAEGKQGYHDGTAYHQWLKDESASPTAFLTDSDGTVGREYGARTTPSMYVINKDGKIDYAGAIDDKPVPDLDAVKGANNYVKDALNDELEGKKISKNYVQSYGCSVKYKEQ